MDLFENMSFLGRVNSKLFIQYSAVICPLTYGLDSYKFLC